MCQVLHPLILPEMLKHPGQFADFIDAGTGLTLPTAKAEGFLLLPLLHWPIPEGTATTYTLSTS